MGADKPHSGSVADALRLARSIGGNEMEWGLALVAVALLGVAAISGRLRGSPITPAILFVAFGLLVGPSVIGGIDLSSAGSTVQMLANATLALVLFCVGLYAA